MTSRPLGASLWTLIQWGGAIACWFVAVTEWRKGTEWTTCVAWMGCGFWLLPSQEYRR